MVLIERYTSVWYECPRCYGHYALKLETVGYPDKLPCQRCGWDMVVRGTSHTEIFDDDGEWLACWRAAKKDKREAQMLGAPKARCAGLSRWLKVNIDEDLADGEARIEAVLA